MAAVTVKKWWRVASLLGVLACAQDQPILSGLAPDEQDIVLQYLTCIDCIIPLDSVRALASKKAQATVDSLNSGLLHGPGTQAVANVDSVLVLGYVRDSSWRVLRGLSPLPLRVVYVSEARQRYVDGYRSRGATGMGWIHTPRAVAHLDSALTLTLPVSVRRAVAYARDSLPPP